MKNLSRFGAVVAGTSLIAVAATTGATAAKWIDSGDIKNGSIRSIDIKDGAVSGKDLRNGVEKAIARRATKGYVNRKVADVTAGKDDAASDVLGKSVVAKSFAPVNVEKVGGKFADRATDIGSFELEAGTYLISSDAFFMSNAATSGQTRMQLALRAEDGSEWGKDLGTCFTGLASVLPDREVTCNTTRTVVVEDDVNVKVQAFGYADDQGAADSGKFDVTTHVSAIKVG